MTIRKRKPSLLKPGPRAKRKRIPVAKIMSIYQRRLRLHNAMPVKNVSVSQRNIRIGTGEDWTNAIEVTRNPAWVEVNNADYVWSDRNPTGDFAVVSRRFRIPRGDIERGSLFLSVDNYAVVLINGRIVVYDNPEANAAFFNPGRTFNVRRLLRNGRNDIVIIAFNLGGARSDANPAGVAARLDIRVDD
ncbi:hypothetical protein FE782_22455 [Paenibacillus antri]|uniref:Glycosyl hydrolases family 2 sugar binding domain-containing protein n=1 Tax=Paenibacillus antri TaxID=2582848 RepID=A0A5R9G6V6_9BACL|nr:hypothetical protein [Paenibacillus antri]TLS50096.1 hypothetical protein FE782_22455 [Paenibacillus antri]